MCAAGEAKGWECRGGRLTRHGHVKRRAERANALDGEGAVVLGEDGDRLLLGLLGHRVPEGRQQRIGVLQLLRLEALPALQEVRDPLAPLGEGDAAMRVEVHLGEGLHPGLGLEHTHLG